MAGRSTAFGRDFSLGSIRTYQDFKSAVPVSDYERFRPYIDRLVAGERRVLTRQEPRMFATTSGTVGAQKYIPVTDDYLSEFRRASKVSCFNLYRQFPRLAEGCALSIVSPAEEGRTPGGTPYGAISGALYLMEPEAVRRLVLAVPYEVFSIKDYETRYYCLLRAALALPITSVYTLNPSTILLLAQRLQRYGADLAKDVFDGGLRAPGMVPKSALDSMAGLLRADRSRGRALSRLVERGQCMPQHVWTENQVISCWTRAAAAFYVAGLPEMFGPVPVCDITYGASEGRGSVFLSPEKQMLAIRSHFFEFVPEQEIHSPNPTVLLADELSVGASYFILFTTSAGLYRYHINDVVKVTGFHNRTPLIEFQYKGGNVYSFTGEKITELQVIESMSRALQEHTFKCKFFTLVPEFTPLPHYRVWIEPLAGHEHDCRNSLGRLAVAFDRQLATSNIEYHSKRQSLRLGGVEAELITVGSYEDLRKSLVADGVPDSQIKLSHLNPRHQIRAFLESRLGGCHALV